MLSPKNLPRTAVLTEYAAILYCLVWLPLSAPRVSTCMDFRGLIVVMGAWPLFWCAVCCLPALVCSLTLHGEARRRFQNSIALAAGIGPGLFWVSLFPAGITAAFPMFGIILAPLIILWASVYPYYNLWKDWNEAKQEMSAS